ncbi:MAG: penicillin-binding protein 2 [Anaerolineae bacterium]|nr:penicillin-binding protein 2 [Anaerolineae bacterium]
MTDTVGIANIVASAYPREPVELVSSRIEAMVRDSRQQTPTLSSVLYFGVPPTTTNQIMRTMGERGLKGLTVDDYWARTYPQGKLAGNVLGFVNLQPKGYSGVEGYYNQSLDAEPGQVTALGRMNLTGITLTLAGADLVLTLDMSLQQYVEKRLAQAMQDYGPKGGSIIVMDSKTGAILALASSPGYDPNMALEMANQPGAKLFDPAVTSLYEPGSVIKVLTVAGALEQGVITPNTRIKDEVRFNVGGKFIYNSDRLQHGEVDIQEMLRLSLNVVAAKIANQMGPEKFYDSFRKFGMGAKTGVDLAGEQDGGMRTPSSVKWSKSDLATNSYGQGMTATPLQVLVAINAIANDGVLVQPYMVQQWRHNTGEQTALTNRKIVRVQQVISPETARTMRELMKNATRLATRKALLDGYTVAGKTGTADWYDETGKLQDTTFVTYVGMVPAEQPRITILVKFDQPKTSRWASDTTVPVFHDVAERAVQDLGIPPNEN